MCGLYSSKQRFPEPDTDAIAHSERLQSRIRHVIRQRGGWISFHDFMELALYEPGLGYYSGGAHKFGEAGDFITAPELSPMFSRCIARQCAAVLGEFGNGTLMELGAGSGAMAADVITELASLNMLPDRYLILERSADLRDRQRSLLNQRLGNLGRCVDWLDAIPKQAFSGVVLANEVVDALPCERFRIEEDRLFAYGIGLDGDRLIQVTRPAGPKLLAAFRDLNIDSHRLPPGYESELRPGLAAWVHSIIEPLDAGLALIIDYGLTRAELYSPERSEGTLLCHYRHRAHADPLFHVGLQDITAWVDFTAVAETAVAAGFRIAGYTTQAHFLIGAGLHDMFTDSEAETLKEKLELARQVKLLTLPGEMGERFKVMGLSRNLAGEIDGFAYRDLGAML
ncbi:MAG: SAM-dependent methyltransferase [Gammaproteobacteria bacterium]